MTEKLEQKIIYDNNGNVHSTLIGKVYEPLIILDMPEKAYEKIPLLKPSAPYNALPLIASGRRYEPLYIFGLQKSMYVKQEKKITQEKDLVLIENGSSQ